MHRKPQLSRLFVLAVLISISCTTAAETTQPPSAPVLWTLEVRSAGEPDRPVQVRTPFVHGDSMYLVGQDGTVRALDARTGQLRWDFTGSDWGGIRVEGNSVVSDGLFVTMSGGGAYLHALDAATGEERWRFAVDEWAAAEDISLTGISEVIAVLDDTVFVAASVCCRDDPSTTEGIVVALELPTGEVRWTSDVANGAQSPVSDDGHVIVRSWDGGLHALSADDGTPRWNLDIGGAHLLDGSVPMEADLQFVHDGAVFAIGAGGDLYAVDTASGQIRWTFDLHLTSFIPPAAVATKSVVYVTDGPHLFALDARTGTEEWRLQLEDSSEWILTSPVVSDDVIYVGASWIEMTMPFHDRGTTEIESIHLYAIDPEQQAITAQRGLDDRMPSQLASYDNILYLVAGPLTENDPVSVTAFDVDATFEPRSERPLVQVSGRVMSAFDDQPIDRAQVMLMPTERGTTPPRKRFADARGRYEFGGVPTGLYQLHVEANGYLAGGVEEVFELSEDGTLEGIDIRLDATATISGRVIDPSGNPVPRARVFLRRYAEASEEIRQAGEIEDVDEEGRYVFAGLRPGQYYVSAMPSRQFILSPSKGPSPPPRTDGTEGLAATFHPSTTDLAGAAPVMLSYGDIATGIDIEMVGRPTASVSGVVIASDGRPASNGFARFRMATEWSPNALESSLMSYEIWLNEDGTFDLPHVLAGTYGVWGGTELDRTKDSFRRHQENEFGHRILEVGDTPIDDLHIQTAPPANLRGTVVVEGPGAPTVDLQRVTIHVKHDPGVPEWRYPTRQEAGRVNVLADGSFEFPVNRPLVGIMRLAVEGSYRGEWTTKSITIDGRDVTYAPVDFIAGDSVTARVVLTTKVASINGFLAAPAAGAAKVALVFADDPIRWNSSLAFRMGWIDAEGRFEVGGLPPGRYRVVALEQVPEDYGHPALFGSLRQNAALVELEEGESQTVELSRLVRP